MSRNKVRKQQAVERHNAQYAMHRQLEELNAKNSLLFEPHHDRSPGKSKSVAGHEPHDYQQPLINALKEEPGYATTGYAQTSQ